VTETAASQAQPAARRANPARDVALIAVFAAFISVCSIIAIPVGAAPITLQTFAVLLAGAVLGANRGFLAVLLYLAVGAVGIPVFAGGASGLATFATPTAGYLVSFPLAAWLAGFIVERIPRRGAAVRTLLVFVAAIVASLVFIYPLGIAGLMWLAQMSLPAAVTLNVGFVLFDLVKMTLVALVAGPVHRAFPALLPQRAARPAR